MITDLFKNISFKNLSLNGKIYFMEEKNMKKISIIILALLCGAIFTTALAAEGTENRQTLTGASLPRIGFTSYAGIGGGAGATLNGEVFPMAGVSSGIQFKPWLALGGYLSAAPLSNFDHADFGLSIADQENGYFLASGAELLITPFSDKMIHPMFRMAIGGISVGYLEDNDGIEGMDSAVQERFFHAALSAGAELNFTRHTNLYFRAGGRFSGNTGIVGLGNGELSGFEAEIGMRFFWKTLID